MLNALFAKFKLYIYLGAFAVIAAAVGYHFWTVSSFKDDLATAQATISSQREELIVAKADLQTAKDANDSLVRAQERIQADAEVTRQELLRLTAVDAAAQEQLRQLQAHLADKTRIERQQQIRDGEKASLLLEIYNANVKCQLDNFARTGGRCVAGRWVAGSVPNN